LPRRTAQLSKWQLSKSPIRARPVGRCAVDHPHLDVVETDFADGSEQSDADDGFAGSRGHFATGDFLLPTEGPAPGAETALAEHRAFLVVEGDHKKRHFGGGLSWADAFAGHATADFELPHFAAVDGGSLEGLGTAARLFILESHVVFA